MKLAPDNFDPISNDELRELWRRYRDPDVRRLILEVHRGRSVVDAAHADALTALYASWEKQDGNVKASLQAVIDRLLAEKMRLGAMGGRCHLRHAPAQIARVDAIRPKLTSPPYKSLNVNSLLTIALRAARSV